MICWMVMPIIPCQNHSVRLSRPDNGTQDKSDLMRLVYLRIERASPDLKASTFLQSGVVHVSVSNLEIEKPTVLFQLFPFSFYDSPIPFHFSTSAHFLGGALLSFAKRKCQHFIYSYHLTSNDQHPYHLNYLNSSETHAITMRKSIPNHPLEAAAAVGFGHMGWEPPGRTPSDSRFKYRSDSSCPLYLSSPPTRTRRWRIRIV